MAFRLTFELGERTERRPLPPGDHLVGSGTDCGVRIAHPTVSRRHALLRVAGDRVEIEELGSRNGTRVDGAPLEGRRPLEPGARLQLGSIGGRLEAVDDGDLEVAVPFAAGPDAAAAEDSGRLAALTTASMGSMRSLVADELPAMLDLLDAEAGPLRMAQAAGGALFRSLPCLAVEVRDREGPQGGGVLFVAERTAGAAAAPAGEDADALAEAEAGRYRVRVRFAHPTQARGFAPLVAALARLIAAAAGRRRPRSPAAPPPASPPLPEPATVVPEMHRIYDAARHVARGDVSVLIEGESGTGKEVLARFLHAASPRAGGAFVALNCAALPRDLLEAELFGIEEKVATGVAPRPGKFEMADGGTLFLDEIGDMAAETQARILRVLQEGEVYRIGGRQPRPARVRTLAATNREIDSLLASGDFRGDLFHRVADWRVTLPPLRRRRADVPNLAAWFLAREAERRGIAVAGISRAALDLLTAYPWPGNVRQLEREMARAALFLEAGDVLESTHLAGTVRAAASSPPGSLREVLARAERREIVRAIAACDGDVTAAARELGIGRSTLYRRMAELGIERPEG
jgi:DNA-binding NtrC family response regulator